MHQLYVPGARQKKLRLKKEDAWNLYEEALIVEVDTQTGAAKQSIDIAVQSPRDGRVGGGRIYFTTVDGRLVIANVDTHQVDQVIDLRKIGGTNHLLEWCRGLLPVDERRTWVAFTRVRKTQFTENVLWVKKMLQEGTGEKPTHIALYDIVEGQCLAKIDMEPHGLNVIYRTLPAFEGSARSQSHTDAQD